MANIRCSNSDIPLYTRHKEVFETHNKTVYSKWQRTLAIGNEVNDVYVVYSYGYHFPMYVWDEQAHVWIGNKDKYSRTTSSHQNYARPYHVEYWFDTPTMLVVVSRGLAGAIAKRME